MRALYPRLSMDTEETRRKKLRFRAWRRGFREADLILGPFADSHVPSFTQAQMDVFETLLDQPDQDLYEWIVERTPTPPEFDTEIMSLIKRFRSEAYEARGGPHGG